MKLERIKIVYSALLMHFNVFGQKSACNDDDNVLDRCDGKVVSNNNIYIDFGEIRYQCDCMISPNSSGMSFYQLVSNPGYDNCGTAVHVVDSNNDEYRLPCATIQSSVAIRNRSSLVELTQENTINGPTNYCLWVLTNDISKIIIASCGFPKCTSTDTNSRLTTRIGLPGYVLLIGLLICGTLVLILTGIITSLVIYILKSRKGKPTTKNDRNTTEIPEHMVTFTSPQNRPNSAYTTLNPGPANDLIEQPYTGLNIINVPEVSQASFSTRPNSGYTALNPKQDKAEQLYTGLTNDPVYNESN